jgi:hypothetical protein
MCVQDVLWWVLYKAENVLLGSSLRKAALKEVRETSSGRQMYVCTCAQEEHA